MLGQFEFYWFFMSYWFQKKISTKIIWNDLLGVVVQLLLKKAIVLTEMCFVLLAFIFFGVSGI